MQVVINISEEEYKCVRITGHIGNATQVSNAIFTGKPLPKGHGRLVDADALASEIKDLKKSLWYKDNTNLAYLPRKEAVEIIEEIIVGDAPTIIEADKEAEDK